MIRVTNTESNNITTPYISAKQSQSSQQQIELQAKPNQQPQYNYRQLLQLNESQELIEEEQAQRFAVLKSDFSLISLFDFQKVNGLGRLHLAKLKDQKVICREIQFNRVKDYVLEDIIKDMQQTMKLGLRQAILPILGIYQDPKSFTLNIFMPQMISLYQFISQGKHHLTATLKKDIALGIANALREIHQKPRDIMRDSQQGYYSHTHLSSHNVLLDVQDLSNLQVLLADMESENLRKYAKLFMQYNFINAWSPPELMISDSSRRVSDTPPRSQNSQVFLNLSQQSDNSGNGDKRSIDCYSFGMILWELEHEEPPFHGKSDLDIRTLVCDQSMRPTISPKANPALQALIRSCWHKRADRRPNIEQIYQELQGVEFQSEIGKEVQAASQINPSLLKLKSCQLKTPGVRSRGSSRSKVDGNESGGSFYISFRNSDIQE
ncbi:hypothetical protein FGO68_gene3892 [Halteria grandinella]|uniref:Protein kinase domain-containing protein n=1 Tax=Halteria grandinella TaxID=5974 RepID=A0A8J8SWX1_HALGN|nr:hypothetical protein FGO68_gene3892 [Halteria grandinella]